MRPGPSTVGTGSMTIRFRTFRNHHRPCGQPAVEGGLQRFWPVPAQTAHFTRINATPSDLPFQSTGFATYPVPLQLGQKSRALSPPQDCQHCARQKPKIRQRCFFVTNHEQRSQPGRRASKPIHKTRSSKSRMSRSKQASQETSLRPITGSVGSTLREGRPTSSGSGLQTSSKREAPRRQRRQPQIPNPSIPT